MIYVIHHPLTRLTITRDPKGGMTGGDSEGTSYDHEACHYALIASIEAGYVIESISEPGYDPSMEPSDESVARFNEGLREILKEASELKKSLDEREPLKPIGENV